MPILVGNKQLSGFRVGLDVGTVLGYPEKAANIPSCFIPCDGRTVAKASYPDLYDVIGDNYGHYKITHGFIPNTSDKKVIWANSSLMLALGATSSTENILYKSSDGGETWTSAVTLIWTSINDKKVSVETDGTYFLIYNDIDTTVYYSVNSGSSFAYGTINSDYLVDGEMAGLKFCILSPGYALVYNSSGVDNDDRLGLMTISSFNITAITPPSKYSTSIYRNCRLKSLTQNVKDYTSIYDYKFVFGLNCEEGLNNKLLLYRLKFTAGSTTYSGATLDIVTPTGVPWSSQILGSYGLLDVVYTSSLISFLTTNSICQRSDIESSIQELANCNDSFQIPMPLVSEGPNLFNFNNDYEMKLEVVSNTYLGEAKFIVHGLNNTLTDTYISVFGNTTNFEELAGYPIGANHIIIKNNKITLIYGDGEDNIQQYIIENLSNTDFVIPKVEGPDGVKYMIKALRDSNSLPSSAINDNVSTTTSTYSSAKIDELIANL